jgi:hypothetical protein
MSSFRFSLISSITLGIVAVSCRPANTGPCGTGANTASIGAAAAARTPGGFVSFTLDTFASGTGSASSGEKRCSAVFDFSQPIKDGKKPIKVFTAGHCTGNSLDDVLNARIDVWGGDGYTPNVPIQFTAAEARQNALRELGRYGGVDESVFPRSRVSFPVDVPDLSCVGSEGGSPLASQTASQELCFSWVDLVSLDATMDAGLYESLRLALPAVPIMAQSGSPLGEFFKSHQKLMNLRQDTFYAVGVDMYHSCLAEAGLCTQQKTAFLEDALTHFVFIGGKPALEAARMAGVNSANSSFTDVKREEFRNLFEQMKMQWSMMQPSDLTILTNTTEPKVQLGTKALSAFGTNVQFQKEPTGLRVFVPNQGSTMRFFEGDSGSLVLSGGRAPVLTLHAVNGKETSGGAALAPLPVRANPRAPSNISSSDSVNPCN